jgi:hypothetical protein
MRYGSRRQNARRRLLRLRPVKRTLTRPISELQSLSPCSLPWNLETEASSLTTESFEHEEKLRDDSLLDAASDAPTLVCFTEDKPTRYELTQRVVTIGRSTDCDIQILTHYVSREHARIYNRKGVITIEDLGSKNGIFVNSVRVESQILSHGDWLTIGETQFRFSDPGAS